MPKNGTVYQSKSENENASKVSKKKLKTLSSKNIETFSQSFIGYRTGDSACNDKLYKLSLTVTIPKQWRNSHHIKKKTHKTIEDYYYFFFFLFVCVCAFYSFFLCSSCTVTIHIYFYQIVETMYYCIVKGPSKISPASLGPFHFVVNKIIIKQDQVSNKSSMQLPVNRQVNL